MKQALTLFTSLILTGTAIWVYGISRQCRGYIYTPVKQFSYATWLPCPAYKVDTIVHMLTPDFVPEPWDYEPLERLGCPIDQEVVLEYGWNPIFGHSEL